MRFLILNADYPLFLHDLYSDEPGMASWTYARQLQARTQSLFGVADFYSRNLRKIGHEAVDIYVNNWPLQEAWAREHGLPVQQPRRVTDGLVERMIEMGKRTPFRRSRLLRKLLRPPASWSAFILAAQLDHYRPDVILNQCMDEVSPGFFLRNRDKINLLIGQNATPELPDQDWSAYDLLLSSTPAWVDRFRSSGLQSELQLLAFEPSVLESVGTTEQSPHASFVGSLMGVHSSRLNWLEAVCAASEKGPVPVRVWGHGFDVLSATSAIRRAYQGRAWGVEMYRVLASSAVTLNHHGDVKFANNLRLYEATGVGTLLITDAKPNLPQLFNVGEEVLVYRDPEECYRLICRWVEADDQRKRVARQGQMRTLASHTFELRVKELVDLIQSRLCRA